MIDYWNGKKKTKVVVRYYWMEHDVKACLKKYTIHKEIFYKMGFPENWQRIGRIKKYTKYEIY